ncbi:MAG: TolC family protein, partial [Cytophagales bacterium]|nr:TolC family protein [Cytophagales bacterium]
MRTRIVNLFVGLTFSMAAYAQPQTPSNPETYTFTLKQCIDFALQSNVNVKNAILDQQASSARVKEVRAIGFPQAAGTFGMQHSDPLRAFFARGGGAFTPGLDPNKVYSAPNFFQLQNAADLSFTINQLILSSTYIIGLEAADMYKQLMEKSTEVTRINTVENVTKAYFLVLVNLERKNLFDVNISRLDSTLQQTKAFNKNGFAESIDVDRIQVQLNNLITEKQKFENLLLVSNIALRFQMGFPLDQELVLAERISNFPIENPVSLQDEKFDYEKRVEVQLQKQNLKLLKKDVELTNWGYAPTLAGSINFGWFTQNSKFSFFEKDNTWANYATYSIGLNIPIFDGMSKYYQGQQKKVTLIKAENSYKNLESVIDLQIKSNRITLNNYYQTLEI